MIRHFCNQQMKNDEILFQGYQVNISIKLFKNIFVKLRTSTANYSTPSLKQKTNLDFTLFCLFYLLFFRFLISQLFLTLSREAKIIPSVNLQYFIMHLRLFGPQCQFNHCQTFVISLKEFLCMNLAKLLSFDSPNFLVNSSYLLKNYYLYEASKSNYYYFTKSLHEK